MTWGPALTIAAGVVLAALIVAGIVAAIGYPRNTASDDAPIARDTDPEQHARNQRYGNPPLTSTSGQPAMTTHRANNRAVGPFRRCYAPPRTMQRTMAPGARLLSALAVCVIALAACGSSSKPSSSGSPGTQAVKYADWMRANGVPNFPDPGSNGALPNPALPAFRAARRAGAKLQPVGLHLGGPAAPTAAELRAALAFAECMRKHGFSQFPDPLTTYGPGFTLGRAGVLSEHQRDRAAVAGVHASSQGLRSAASLGLPHSHLGQARGGARPTLAPAGGARDGSSEPPQCRRENADRQAGQRTVAHQAPILVFDVADRMADLVTPSLIRGPAPFLR
jgi:hypothetical protein